MERHGNVKCLNTDVKQAKLHRIFIYILCVFFTNELLLTLKLFSGLLFVGMNSSSSFTMVEGTVILSEIKRG